MDQPTKKKDEDDFILSFSDLVAIVKRNRRKIYFGTAAFSIVSLLWTLTNPIEYVAEATFRDKAKAQTSMSTLTLFLGGAGNSNDDAISLMKSRAISEELVKRLGLQMNLTPVTYTGLTYPELIWQNLIVENAIFNSSLTPSLKDVEVLIRPQDIVYEGETPKYFSVKFISEDTYEVHDNTPEPKKGKLDEPFKGSNYEFTLVRRSENPLTGITFGVSLNRLSHTADNIAKQLRIEPDRMDRNLLNIKYNNRNRHMAVEVVNTLAEVYKDYLHKEQERIIGYQIKYLEQRQDEIGQNLKETMESHIQNLSEEMKNIGFANSKVAMEFLTGVQNQFQQKLLNMEFEVKRLLKAQKEGYAYYDGYSLPGDPAIINHILNEMRNLKQQGDWLDLALRNTPPANEESSKKQFEEQLSELEKSRKYREEAKTLLADVEAGIVPKAEGSLAQDPKYLVKIWHEKLTAAANSLKDDPEEWQKCQTQFCAYLANLVHHFDVHENALEERLSHQQGGEFEFEGIDLNTSRELYLGYSRVLNDLEAQILQNQFVIGKLDDSEFELSSLSMLMGDHVSNELISHSSHLARDLKDQNNRSLKEQERIKEELDVQKRHLATHLKNAIELLRLKQDLIKYKVRALQNVTLGLVQQQISLLERHLSDYIANRLKDIKQEKDIIEQHKVVLRNQMASLPTKWVSEMLIDQQMEVNKRMVEEVSRIVESKIISNNIEISQSNLIDKAIAPIHPKSPRLIFFAILGAFMGCFLTTTFLLARELISGVHASRKNLQLGQQHVAGRLSSRKLNSTTTLLPDQDLDTLRRLIAYISTGKTGEGQSLLFVQGRGPDYAHNLALLLAKKGLKVLLFTLSFDTPAKPEELPGLLQYLEGKADTLKIEKWTEKGAEKGSEFDTLAAGGISRFSNEMLGSEAFKKLLQQLTQQYDWVIAVTHAMPEHAETESLLKIFGNAVINVTDEKLDDLKGSMQIADEFRSEKRISFVLS